MLARYMFVFRSGMQYVPSVATAVVRRRSDLDPLRSASVSDPPIQASLLARNAEVAVPDEASTAPVEPSLSPVIDPDESGDPDQTMVMKVANIGFLLERLGEDCDDLQYLRELTQNALEARARRVVWDVDWTTLDVTDGTYKLCCIDDGIGMTAEEMVMHINRLSSSGGTQAIDANFGVGAKISAATRNPAGVIYQSWVDGNGTMVQLWRDPTTRQYGLKQFRRTDGTYSHVVRLAEKAKPDLIGQHGTKVVLLGTGKTHDTMEAPPGAPTKSRWVSRNLGSRYFRFPRGVEVRAREGWLQPRSDTERNLTRRIMGMEEFLDRYSDSSGRVPLERCDVHWWILDASEARRAYSLPNAGHFAALYQDELYELATGRAGTARLQQFGVIFGSDRVVLYVEPRSGSANRLMANTARTQLILDGAPLPYAEWASEFRREMPQEIRDHMDAVIAGARDASHQQIIQERLKTYSTLYRLSRHRIRTGGPENASGPLEPSNSREREDATAEHDTPAKQRTNRDPTGDMLASILAADGEQAESTNDMEPIFPRTVWISQFNDPPTRAADELDDRAAKYLPDDNLIQINGDFRVFVDMEDHWCREYDLTRGNDVIVGVVQEWFEQALIETVIGAQQLQGDRRWSSDDIERVLSEEALTAAVMQRYHVANAIKRSLGSKLGTLRDRSEALTA
jgi:hypothetical protein